MTANARTSVDELVHTYPDWSIGPAPDMPGAWIAVHHEDDGSVIRADHVQQLQSRLWSWQCNQRPIDPATSAGDKDE